MVTFISSFISSCCFLCFSLSVCNHVCGYKFRGPRFLSRSTVLYVYSCLIYWFISKKKSLILQSCFCGCLSGCAARDSWVGVVSYFFSWVGVIFFVFFCSYFFLISFFLSLQSCLRLRVWMRRPRFLSRSTFVYVFLGRSTFNIFLFLFSSL